VILRADAERDGAAEAPRDAAVPGRLSLRPPTVTRESRPPPKVLRPSAAPAKVACVRGGACTPSRNAAY